MNEPAPLESGRWYSLEGSPPSRRGRPVQIRRYEANAVLGRFADGSERLIPRRYIGRQVEDAIPGVTEPCLVCDGKEVVPIIESSEDEPLSGRRVGTRPCPNCRGLH